MNDSIFFLITFYLGQYIFAAFAMSGVASNAFLFVNHQETNQVNQYWRNWCISEV